MIEPGNYSVVIPVFNSEKIIGETVKRICDFFISIDTKYEVILVNDGSSDSSWDVISDLARNHETVKAINLLKNYGQHNANFCGFKAAKGDYVITMDDDLQNPPEEIQKLIDGVKDGTDLVIGRFNEKKHSLFRRIGSKMIGKLIRNIFHSQNDLILTNFRIIHRDVIERVCEYKSNRPYIPGLVLMFSSSQKNVPVDHHPRKSGKSNYGLFKIIRLVATILFNYSSIPLRFMAGFGFIVSALSLTLALYYFVSAIVSGVSVPGWSTLVILLSFFNGILILLVSVVGEYVVRLLRERGSSASYYIKDIVE